MPCLSVISLADCCANAPSIPKLLATIHMPTHPQTVDDGEWHMVTLSTLPNRPAGPQAGQTSNVAASSGEQCLSIYVRDSVYLAMFVGALEFQSSSGYIKDMHHAR